MRRWRSRNVLRTKSVFDVLYRPPKQRSVLTTIARIARGGCWSHARTKFWEAAVATQHFVAREALARIMRMFHLDNSWKNRLPDPHCRTHMSTDDSSRTHECLLDVSLLVTLPQAIIVTEIARMTANRHTSVRMTSPPGADLAAAVRRPNQHFATWHHA